VETWWQQHRSGQSVPDAPDPEYLARVLISALDITRQAYFAQKDWELALRRSDTSLEVKRTLQRPEEDIATTRTNRAIVLGHLHHFSEAQAELETCLQIFHNDPAMRAKVFNSLANLFAAQDDIAQAIIQQRRALTLCEQLPDPRDRAISHGSLANHLERGGSPSTLTESARHQLAALIYRLVVGLGEHLQTSLRNYALICRRTQAAGTLPTVPRVAELLADPAFHPLDDWLRLQQVDVAEVQAGVDQFLEQARQVALEQK